MTAQEFVNKVKFPVLFFTSIGTPTGVDIAILESTELPFDLSDLEGEEIDGAYYSWEWDGEGKPSDWNSNSVLMVQVRNDQIEHQRQEADYNNGY